MPAQFLLSYSVFDYDFSLFFVSGPCARLSWPSRQLLSARKSTVSYRIVSYPAHEMSLTLLQGTMIMSVHTADVDATKLSSLTSAV